MNRFLYALAALLCLFTAELRASDWLINSYRFAAAPPAGMTVTFLQCNTTTSGTAVYTWAAQNVGSSPGADRWNVIALAHSDTASQFHSLNVTVGGAPATNILDQNGIAGIGNISTAWWKILNTAGTSEDVVVTFNENLGSATLCLFEVTGVSVALNVVSSIGFTAASDTPCAITLPSTSATGFATAISHYASSITTSATWSNYTELTDFDAGGTNITVAEAVPTDGGSLAGTITYPSSTTGRACSAVAFEDATEPAPAASAATISATPYCNSSTSDLTTYSFSSTNIGASFSNRSALIAVFGRDGTNTFSTASVAVDGQPATELTGMDLNVGDLVISFHTILKPTGGNFDVSPTFSEAIGSGGICVWALDVSSLTPVDTASVNNGTTGNAITLNLDVSADGIAGAICATGHPTAPHYTWVGFTENNDAQFAPAGTGSGSYSAATFDNDASADIPLTASCDPSTTGENNGGLSVSFR